LPKIRRRLSIDRIKIIKKGLTRMSAILDLYRYLEKGGIVMIPLLLCSVLALAIFILKIFHLRRRKVIFPEIVQVIEKIQQPEEIDLARRVCEERKGAFANVILIGLENRALPREELKEAIVDQGRQEARSLERGLVALETIAGIAPLLGLLGTVLGMVDVFNEISKTDAVQVSQLSDGISKALITTVVGLTIGIPALVAYNYLIEKSETLILEIEKHSGKLIHKLRHFQIKAELSHGGSRADS
jgi:biopolymer transport protein ExbB